MEDHRRPIQVQHEVGAPSLVCSQLWQPASDRHAASILNLGKLEQRMIRDQSVEQWFQGSTWGHLRENHGPSHLTYAEPAILDMLIMLNGLISLFV